MSRKVDQSSGLKSQIETGQTLNSIAGGLTQRAPKQRSYVMDLRIHSPVSLGYIAIDGIDTAPALVRLARVKGIDTIALTDFYSGEFIDRVSQAAKENGVTLIPGTVIRAQLGSCDDVVLSCLFPEEYTSAHLRAFLDQLGVPERARGDKNYLLKLPFADILRILHSHGGVALPSRMDKLPNRMAAIPELVEKYGFRTFDLAFADSVRFFKTRWPKMKFNLYSFSNAHALAQVGSRIAKVKMQEGGFAGLKALLQRTVA
jgi:hypothetical protein